MPPIYKHVPMAERRRTIDAVKNGATRVSEALRLGVHEHTVERWCKDAGVPTTNVGRIKGTPNRSPRSKRIDKMVELYRQGLTLTEIARHQAVGRSLSSVRATLIKWLPRLGHGPFVARLHPRKAQNATWAQNIGASNVMSMSNGTAVTTAADATIGAR